MSIVIAFFIIAGMLELAVEKPIVGIPSVIAFFAFGILVNRKRHGKMRRRNRHGVILYGSNKKYQKFVQHERALVTPTVRYDILRRDGFRCQICGRTQSDGVILHVDHIKPVSKVGRSEPDNLRTLCEECNRGKAAKYHYNELN